MQRNDIRNLAIIAHVDHGKTTLLDRLLERAGALDARKSHGERVMDSNPLEKERGITILAKCTSLVWKGVRVNIVDTPGHADFGGEVERVLNLVDSALLLVDAFEGPMPQTRFVLRKALERGLKPIVVVNKIDRPNSRPDEALSEVFDLFAELGADEEQLDFAYCYGSAKQGFMQRELADSSENVDPLLDLILEKVPAPDVDLDGPFRMLVSDIAYDNYLGRLLLGRVERGRVTAGMAAARVDVDGQVKSCRLGKLFRFDGLARMETDSAQAGDIILVAGAPEGLIGETLADPNAPEPLPPIRVDAPTISMNFRVNDGPLAGREGKFVTSRQVRERLMRELLSNVALRVEDTDTTDELRVSGRGELHLSILIETMRREGYEFTVSRPKVVMKEVNGKQHEPVEELILELPEDRVGSVMEELGRRQADITHIEPVSKSTTRVTAHIPTRGLTGFRSQFLTLTKGEGVMSHSLLEYRPFKGDTRIRQQGVLVALEAGESVPYAIFKLEDRGYFIIGPGEPVYEGMILGSNSRENDLVVNVCLTKKLTNIRASGKDEAVRLTPPRRPDLEQALEFIADDELVEVTPKSIRLRKRYLSQTERDRMRKAKKSESA